MCINILEGDNSPRVKDTGIQDVTQHMQTLNIHVSPADLVEWNEVRTLMGSILRSIHGNRQALPLFLV